MLLGTQKVSNSVHDSTFRIKLNLFKRNKKSLNCRTLLFCFYRTIQRRVHEFHDRISRLFGSPGTVPPPEVKNNQTEISSDL
jgi:hypothetical protein